ncbi:hypothetical protein HPB50_013022 [Hyalomma asiaticum]|uniref:Uncharacterized protein n=1 Tax=Hyalomma asiaticum TaxID=266040 RepID=A0ACB7SKJ6_HYAAI|nr:hypothetical protein HPB50_013022 [Hyalomma asiaticum]
MGPQAVAGRCQAWCVVDGAPRGRHRRGLSAPLGAYECRFLTSVLPVALRPSYNAEVSSSLGFFVVTLCLPVHGKATGSHCCTQEDVPARKCPNLGHMSTSNGDSKRHQQYVRCGVCAARRVVEALQRFLSVHLHSGDIETPVKQLIPLDINSTLGVLVTANSSSSAAVSLSSAPAVPAEFGAPVIEATAAPREDVEVLLSVMLTTACVFLCFLLLLTIKCCANLCCIDLLYCIAHCGRRPLMVYSVGGFNVKLRKLWKPEISCQLVELYQKVLIVVIGQAVHFKI